MMPICIEILIKSWKSADGFRHLTPGVGSMETNGKFYLGRIFDPTRVGPQTSLCCMILLT
jgi:hypothetical protein